MNKKQQRGISYIEVLVALVLISVTLVPALEALQGAMVGAEVHEDLTQQKFNLQSKLEDVLAKSFTELITVADIAGSNTVATSYSDAAGVTNRRLVYLAKYDVDNIDADNNPFTGVEDDILWVRVEIENSALSFETLTSP